MNSFSISKLKNNLQIQYKKLDEKIKLLPKGKLLCSRNGKYFKYYKSNGKNPIYINKKNHTLAEKLAIKQYYTLQLSVLSHKIKLINDYEAAINFYNASSEHLLSEISGFSPLIQSYFKNESSKLTEWNSELFEHNNSHPEHLIHKTLHGEFVRSKSEVIIANALYSKNIPYRYECCINFGNIAIFPDFTILHPKTLECTYWEHFGMMDNSSYRENVFHKLNTYCNYGIYPSVNLITTFETLTHPMDSEKIQQIIEENFCLY